MAGEPITVRRATDADAGHLARFNIAMALETEHKHLLPDVVDAGVRRLLAEPAFGFYLVAERAGELVASAMVTTEWSDWRNGCFWWIQSVYVLPPHRRRGAFRTLYASIQALAAEQGGVCGWRLYVEKDNANAAATYRNLGMVETEYRVMEELRPGIRWLHEG